MFSSIALTKCRVVDAITALLPCRMNAMFMHCAVKVMEREE